MRRVTQENRGKYTAGIDGLIYTTSEARGMLLDEIGRLNPFNYHCLPVRRVYIPKPRGGLRPLGIPTIKDRVMQAVVKMALEAEWEARFEPNSYGYRPGRRCQDAIQQIRSITMRVNGNKGSPWVLDADIAGCFDNINHEKLLEKVPVFRETIRRWLKAGVVEFSAWHETLAGTPQGGIISPLLANIALDGMERAFGMETLKGNYVNPYHRQGRNKGVSLVRYADDFVNAAPSREVIITHVIPILRSFLAERGLALKGAKTRIVHIEDGFDFLGFSLRQFPCKTGKFACIVRPSKESVKKLLGHVSEVLSRNKQAKADDIVTRLNQIIIGWCNYYRWCNAKATFGYIDSRIWQMLWRWCVRRHESKDKNKSKGWIKNRYFMRVGNRDWVFGERADHVLQLAARIKIGNRYVKVKGCNSPYDPALHAYWEKRGYWRVAPGIVT